LIVGLIEFVFKFSSHSQRSFEVAVRELMSWSVCLFWHFCGGVFVCLGC